MAGFYKKVRVFQFISSEDGVAVPGASLIETEDKPIICTEHQDVVSCMVSCEGRYYSAGYDRKIVIMGLTCLLLTCRYCASWRLENQGFESD